MEHLLPGMEPPKRTPQEKQASLRKIQASLSQTKKRSFNYPYIGVVIATIAVCFLLLASLQPANVQETTTATAEVSVKNIYVFKQTEYHDGPRTMMGKWYNVDKHRLNSVEQKLVIPLLSKLQVVEEPIQPLEAKEYNGMIVQYDDGTELFLQIDPSPDNLRLIQPQSNSIIPLEREEFYDMIFLDNGDRYSLFNQALRLLAVVFLYVFYRALLEHVSPARIYYEEQKRSNKWKIGLGGIGVYFGLAFVAGLSAYYTDAINVWFIISFFTIFILIRFLIQSWIKQRQYSFYELPIAIVTYSLLVIILFH